MRKRLRRANRLTETASNKATEIRDIGYSVNELERIEKVILKDSVVRNLKMMAEKAEEKEKKVEEKGIDYYELAALIEQYSGLTLNLRHLLKEFEDAIKKRDKARLEAGVCPLCDTDLREK